MTGGEIGLPENGTRLVTRDSKVTRVIYSLGQKSVLSVGQKKSNYDVDRQFLSSDAAKQQVIVMRLSKHGIQEIREANVPALASCPCG